MAKFSDRSRSFQMPSSRSLCSNMLLWIYITLIHCTLFGDCDSTDFRITEYEDLLARGNTRVYSFQGASDFSQLTVDADNNQVIVGARNNIIRLDMDTLNQLEKAHWPQDEESRVKCGAHGKSPEDCQNFIRVLLLRGDRVFTCGTNAFTPTCTWRSATNVSAVEETLPGLAKCPRDPRQNSSSLMTSEGDLYTATFTDYDSSAPGIMRMLGPSKNLRTMPRNSLWLNEPNFISSYEIDDFVYFFFRESAVEYINCGKSDMGGNIVLKDNWTSFVKARLNCSLPGEYPFYFNELQSTYLLEERQLIYAIFTTSPTSIYGSAVCVYNTSSFNAAFSGPFKYSANPSMAWTSMPSSLSQAQCSSPEANALSSRLLAPTPAHTNLLEAQKYQIMDNSVQPSHQIPVVVAENERFTHIAVDEVRTKHRDIFRVLFVITLEGIIKKFITLPHNNKNCLVEEIRIAPPGRPQHARSLKLDSKLGLLFVGTNDNVYRISVQRCRRFKSRRSCINAQDPYCGWDSQHGECIPKPAHLPDHNWHQQITSCPVLESPVDGGWSDWSEWEYCDQQTFSADKCRCKTRSCDSPSPKYGGQPCLGSRVQVANCTVHGGWSDWNEWSACTSSCGVSRRSRVRSCTNPAPAHGGRNCAGSRVDTIECILQSCPEPERPPIDGSWTEWSHWSLCDKKCGGGIKTRSRACTNPPPQGGADCVGNNIEWEKCNADDCPMLRKASTWSSWIEYNRTERSYSRTRYRFVCRAQVPDQTKMNVFVKPQDQICAGNRCDNSESAPFGWSRWSSWTTCSKLCGGGQQHRERICEGSNHPGGCIGHSREVRFCNEHSCQGSWSCWSEFSPCSVSCGTGRRWRRRDCVASSPGKHYTLACDGEDLEETVCHEPDCETASEGWGQWTKWSLCDENGEQRRARKCVDGGPGNCIGSTVEIRACNYDPDADPVVSDPRYDSTLEGAMMESGIKVYHLVITGLVGFILGGFICVGIFFYCQHRNRKKSQQQFASLPRCHNTPPNEYMTHADLDLLRPISPAQLNSQFYSSTSLQRIKKENMRNMTVKEASQRHSELMRSNSMRTSAERDNFLS